MTIAEAKEIFGYASWATALMLNAAEALPQEQIEAAADAGLVDPGGIDHVHDRGPVGGAGRFDLSC